MNKYEVSKAVHQYLKEILDCTDDDLNSNDIIFIENTHVEPPYIKILAYRKCVIVNVSSDMYKQVKNILLGRNRDEVFEFPLVYGQTIHYVPDVNLLNEPELTDEYTYELLENEEIEKLSYIREFDNSLVFDEEGKTSTKIVFIAKKNDVVIGIAGAGYVTDKMCEVGIDVKPEYRNGGLGSILTRKLTLEILKKGIVPFYSASVTNIGSQMVASRAGYIPCWIDTFGNVYDEYYTYK